MYVMSVKRQEVRVGKEKVEKALELLAQRHFFRSDYSLLCAESL